MYACVYNNLFKPFHGKFGMYVYNCVRLYVPFNFYLIMLDISVLLKINIIEINGEKNYI